MKILIVDDHKLMREGLVRLIETFLPSTEMFQCSNGLEAIEFLKNVPVDLTILDVQMPKLNGIETLKCIKEMNPELKVVMLTQFEESALVSHCLQLGANAFLLKGGDVDEVELTISKVLADGNYFSPFVVELIRKRLSGHQSLANLDLSVTEYQIIFMLKNGYGTKVIAKKLGLTAYTVDSYRKDLLRKTKSKNTVELISLAYRSGLVTTS